jgi:hypothetical protein
MKKLFTLLSVAVLSSAYAQDFRKAQETGVEVATQEELSIINSSPRSNVTQVLSQTLNEDYVQSVSASVCNGLNEDGTPNGVMNGYFRMFDTAEYGITGDMTITHIGGSAVVWPQGYGEGYITLFNGEESAHISNTDAGWVDTPFYGSFAVGPTATRLWGNFEIENFEDEVTVAPGQKFAAQILHPSLSVTVAGTAVRTGSWWPLYTDGGEIKESWFGGPGAGCYSVTAGYASRWSSFATPITRAILLTVKGEVENLGVVELGSSKLAVYPNPATTNVVVKLEDTSIAKVEIVDVTGRVVSTPKAAKDGKINVANLSKGVYFLRVQDDKGVTRIEKLIKK